MERPANSSAHPCKSTTPSSAWSLSACNRISKGFLPAGGAVAPPGVQMWLCPGWQAGCWPETARWVSEAHPAGPWAATGGRWRTDRVPAAAIAPWKPPCSIQYSPDFHWRPRLSLCCYWVYWGSWWTGLSGAGCSGLGKLLAARLKSGSGKDPVPPGCWGWTAQLCPGRWDCSGVGGVPESPGRAAQG